MKHARTLLTAISLVGLGLVLITQGSAYANSNYGVGEYGTCVYGEACSISVSSSSIIDLSVSPTASPTCRVAKDTVDVSTGSSTGYTLQIANQSATSSDMTGATYAGSIVSSTGTPSSPAVLSAGYWGYRVDGLSSFGPGPTSATTTTGSVPSETYAGIPLSGSPSTIRSQTSTPASDPETTDVWYGLCVSQTTTADDYSSGVRYTAVVN